MELIGQYSIPTYPMLWFPDPCVRLTVLDTYSVLAPSFFLGGGQRALMLASLRRIESITHAVQGVMVRLNADAYWPGESQTPEPECDKRSIGSRDTNAHDR